VQRGGREHAEHQKRENFARHQTDPDREELHFGTTSRTWRHGGVMPQPGCQKLAQLSRACRARSRPTSHGAG
jgi:hypothetical protein